MKQFGAFERVFSGYVNVIQLCNFYVDVAYSRTASVIYRSDVLTTDPEVPGSIPGATRFSEKWWVWNGVHSAS
jgi:hypothetical protein